MSCKRTWISRWTFPNVLILSYPTSVTGPYRALFTLLFQHSNISSTRARYRRALRKSLIYSDKFIRTKINVCKYKLLVSSLWIFMFVLIIFRMRRFKLNDWESHFSVVKIVSVLPPIFTSQNIQKSSINITTLDQRNFASMKMCILNSSVKMRRLKDIKD